MTESNQTLTAFQLAEQLGLNPQTIWRWAREGKIPRVPGLGRVVRFRADDVALALDAAEWGSA